LESSVRWASRRRKPLLAAAGAAVLAVLLLVGWRAYRDAQERSAVEAQARAFLQALDRDADPAVEALLAAASRAGKLAPTPAQLRAGAGPGRTYDIERLSVGDDDAQAHVAVTRDGQRQDWELRFRREGGAWLVHKAESKSKTLHVAVNFPPVSPQFLPVA